MPRTALPTPASSTDIPGQDGTKQLAALQLAFELPPPAMTTPAADQASSRPPGPGAGSKAPASSPCPPLQPSSPQTLYPVQPSETAKSRRRRSSASAHQQPARDAFALPPPPTRPRKIIQMKPRPQEQAAAPAEPSRGARAGAGPGRKGGAAGAAAPAPGAGAPAAKKKQPSATSAAGRKTARKTAHSLIERRRRSKMNEEFALLKGMVPACTGEMHKLAILQASIEYVRYLEDCVAKLKARHEARPPLTPSKVGLLTPSGREAPRDHTDSQHGGGGAHCDRQGPQLSPDVEMTDSDAGAASPASAPQHQPPSSSSSTRPPASPALPAEDAAAAAAAPPPRGRHGSFSSSSASTAATADHRHYSYSSAGASPALGPQAHHGHPHGGRPAGPGSALTSPALPPLGGMDLDREVMAALLMLNTDRRAAATTTTTSSTGGGGSGAGAGGGGSGRGMSVRDLLSSV